MYIFGYLRASTDDQDATRAQNALIQFADQHQHRVAGWYVENVSGASLKRPELMRLLNDAQPGDAILIEQIDRLSRLDEDGWKKLKTMIDEKSLKVISLDLPTSHIALSSQHTNDFTSAMLRAINSMLMDMLAAIARKDYEDRRRRQHEGIGKAKAAGKYQGRKADIDKHEAIIKLRVTNGMSIRDTAKLVGVSERTVIRVSNAHYAKNIGTEAAKMADAWKLKTENSINKIDHSIDFIDNPFKPAAVERVGKEDQFIIDLDND